MKIQKELKVLRIEKGWAQRLRGTMLLVRHIDSELRAKGIGM